MSTPLEQQLARLGDMSPAELRAEWRRVFRKPSPKISPDLLRRSIAYQLQERVHGGLSSDVKREIARLIRKLERKGSLDLDQEISLKPGTRLVREWNGRTHHVLALDDGFIFESRHFTSLSHVAREITGTHWSGPRFFGLRKRRLPKRGKGAMADG